MKAIPVNSAELIEQLDKDEPLVNPKPGIDHDTFWYNAGRRSLIDDLKFRLQFTEEQLDILNLEVTNTD